MSGGGRAVRRAGGQAVGESAFAPLRMTRGAVLLESLRETAPAEAPDAVR